MIIPSKKTLINIDTKVYLLEDGRTPFCFTEKTWLR